MRFEYSSAPCLYSAAILHSLFYELYIYTWVSCFPCGSAGKESVCNVGNLGSIPELGRSLGKGKGYPLQYSGLENSTDCIVHGVTKEVHIFSDFLQFSRSVVSDSLRPRESQHARPPCPSPIPGVHSDSCPSSQ